MSMNLACSNDYSRDYFVKGSDLTSLQIMLIRLSVPFYLPFLVLSAFYGSMTELNMMTRKKDITGVMNCASSSVLEFQKIKDLSKKLGITINDLVSSSISVSLNQIFKENNQPVKEALICIPANIRFKFYPTAEKVRLENKFSAIPLILPLSASMHDALPKVKKAFGALKSQFGMVYASYAMTRFLQKLMPRSLSRLAVSSASSKFTLGFSNTPGPIKPMYYVDHEGNKIFTKWSQPHMIVAGQTGLAINCMSFVRCFRITVTSDQGILDVKNTQRLCQLIELNIQKLMEESQNIQESKKDK